MHMETIAEEVSPGTFEFVDDSAIENQKFYRILE